jgi:hypothetical protein
VVGDRDDGPQVLIAIPALRQHLQGLAGDDGVMSGVGEIGDQQSFTDDQVNRPGMSGDSVSWKGWSHVSEFVEEVSAGAA